jgi:hypothetical protein
MPLWISILAIGCPDRIPTTEGTACSHICWSRERSHGDNWKSACLLEGEWHLQKWFFGVSRITTRGIHRGAANRLLPASMPCGAVEMGRKAFLISVVRLAP